MKKLFILFVSTLLLSCTGYGDKVSYDGTDIHYLEPVTKEKADATGQFLKEMGFTDGGSKSIQLTKDSLYSFRMVVQEGIAEDTKNDVNFQALGFLLSKDVFEKEPINFVLCDNAFETIRVIPIEGMDTN